MKGTNTQRSIVRHYRNQRRQSLLLIVYNIIPSVGVIKNPEEQKSERDLKITTIKKYRKERKLDKCI